jgi:hypothetical protein
MSKLYKETNQSAKNAIAEDGTWLFGVPAIVAENADPERQHRVKVIIPSIDEDLYFDEWARQMVFCLGNGFGSAFIPPKGSEVVLFGQLGQKFNLFYASLYNEEMIMPEGYDDENNVGVHAPGNVIFIAELLAKIQAQNFDAIIAQTARILANNIESNAQQLNKVLGNQVRVEAQQSTLVKGNQVQVQATNQVQVNGATITVAANGNISIQGENVAIAGSSIKLHGRTVNPVGPPI